jgi:peroxiredoxin
MIRKPFHYILLISVIQIGLAKAADSPGVRATLQSPDTRKAAPEFSLKDEMGNTLSVESYRGKVVLLDFWATWCHGCKEEIPWFSEFQRRYAKSGLRVVGVSMDDDGWKSVKPFLASAKVPYSIVIGNQTMAKEYGIEQMPVAYLIDRKGRIAAAYVGLADRNNVEMNIRAMLANR